MADWFVDGSQVGGNGTDPASAFASITSVVWGAGDRAWVRNTHYEWLTSSMYLGANMLGTTTITKWISIIGWPQAGDPYYDARPARGTTVGWDTDVPSLSVYSLFGSKMPTFAGSNTNNAGGFLLPRGGAVYNVALSQLSTTENDPWSGNDGTSFERYLDNVFLLQNSGGFSKSGLFNFKGVTQFGKVTIPFSMSTDRAFSAGISAQIRHLVIPSQSVIPGCVFPTANAAQFIGLVEVKTNSLQYFLGPNNTANVLNDATASDGLFHIGRVCGIRPRSGVASLGSGGYYGVQIDDYYGDGPGIRCDQSQPTTRVASINEAACDIGSGAINALIYRVSSAPAGQWRYTYPINKVTALRKNFDVVSGTGIEIRVPLYVDSTAKFVPTDSGLRSYLLCAGAAPAHCNSANLKVGSPTAWSGSLISAGSAYLWSCIFTPTETANVPFELVLPWFTTTTSAPVVAQVFFGEPYKV